MIECVWCTCRHEWRLDSAFWIQFLVTTRHDIVSQRSTVNFKTIKRKITKINPVGKVYERFKVVQAAERKMETEINFSCSDETDERVR